LLDQFLENHDGIELINDIKKVNSDIPIIIMTAYGNIKDAIEAIKNMSEGRVIAKIEKNSLILNAKLKVDNEK